MAQALKDSFGPETVEWVGQRLASAVPEFDESVFVAECLRGFDGLELMDRARRISDVMARHLPEDPVVAVPMVMVSLGPAEPGLTGMQPFRYMPFVVFVGQHGLAAFEESMAAQYELTQRFTAEFSIRPFLINEPERTLARLRVWTADPSEHVRRLVSEGTRPRLPWAPRLPAFIADPAPVLELLEVLRDDPSEYVRRSVANNLNDISKDHPELVISVVRRWSADASAERQRLIRHALRTLVKRGDPAALELLGHAGADHLAVADVTIDPVEVSVGGTVRILATVADTRPVPGALEPSASGQGPDESQVESGEEVAVDFVVHFVKANGSSAPKVFKGGRRGLGPGEQVQFTRSVSVAQMSTRTHYPGVHRVEVQVNGRRFDGGQFVVLPIPAPSAQ